MTDTRDNESEVGLIRRCVRLVYGLLYRIFHRVRHEIRSRTHSGRLKTEQDVFSGEHNDRVRAIAWSSVEYFRKQLRQNIQLGEIARRELEGRSDIRALTLACGDMKGEYAFLKRQGATAIDAWDLSEGQRQRCYDTVYDNEVPLNYQIGDINELVLEPGIYDLVYMQQSLHHIEQVEHLVGQIAQSLKPGGIFVLNDYVGEPFLQRGPKQRVVAQRIWDTLPPRLRTNVQGEVLEDIWIPPKKILSPFEAIRSDAILPSMREHFEAVEEFMFGGVIFPVVNNFAQCYDQESDEDSALLMLLWELDRLLGNAGLVEPTFIRGVYRGAAS